MTTDNQSPYKYIQFASPDQVAVYLQFNGLLVGRVEGQLERYGPGFFNSFWAITRIFIDGKHRRLRQGSRLLRIFCKIVREKSKLMIYAESTGEMTSKFLKKNGFTQRTDLPNKHYYTKWGIEEMPVLRFMFFSRRNVRNDNTKWEKGKKAGMYTVTGPAEMLPQVAGPGQTYEVEVVTSRGNTKKVNVTGVFGTYIDDDGHTCHIASYEDPNNLVGKDETGEE